MNKTLLIVSAAIEVATGVALLAAPSAIVGVLVGDPLDSPAALAIGRVAGAALMSLGTACWLASRDPRNRAASGVVAAMLLYNVAAVCILAYARLVTGLTGIGLLPAVMLHAVLACWCVAAVLSGVHRKHTETT